jgi:hypothetical protein
LSEVLQREKYSEIHEIKTLFRSIYRSMIVDYTIEI